MKLPLPVLLFFLLVSPAIGQESHDKEVLKHLNGKEIFWHFDGDSYAIVLDKKKKKWGIHQVNVYTDYDKKGNEIYSVESEVLIPPLFDSLNYGWDVEKRFTIVKDKGKYGILLSPYEIEEPWKRTKCIYDKIKVVRKNGNEYTLAQKDGKWALIDWFEEYEITEFIFDSPNEIPLQQVSEWEYRIIKKARKELQADLVIMDYNNGDGAYKARGKDSQKWGMYQSLGNETKTIIPMAYDSLNFYSWNSFFTAVYNNGKVGFHTSAWSYDNANVTVPCIYDDYQIHDEDPNKPKKLACKRDGKWGWVNWFTGKEESEFKYETKDDLPYPSYEQEYR